MIKNAFFDLDGTLTNPQDGITRCIQYSLSQLGGPSLNQDELLCYIGPPLRQTFSKLLNTEDTNLIEKAVILYRERFVVTGIYENAVYPGIPELLSSLHKGGVRVYLATSKPRIYAAEIIRHFQLAPWLRGVYGSEMDGRFGNKEELLRLVLKELNVNPAESVMIGDRKEDILAGKINGIKTIAVAYGFGSQEEIEGSSPDFICATPSEIRGIILANNRKIIDS
jgi:phosphoglycolate phosphatase